MDFSLYGPSTGITYNSAATLGIAWDQTNDGGAGYALTGDIANPSLNSGHMHFSTKLFGGYACSGNTCVNRKAN
jgi:hypothetical protein